MKLSRQERITGNAQPRDKYGRPYLDKKTVDKKLEKIANISLRERLCRILARTFQKKE
jgi:hypothetical protein